MGALLNPVAQILKPKMPRTRDRPLRSGKLDRIVTATESSFLPDLPLLAVGKPGRDRGNLPG